MEISLEVIYFRKELQRGPVNPIGLLEGSVSCANTTSGSRVGAVNLMD